MKADVLCPRPLTTTTTTLPTTTTPRCLDTMPTVLTIQFVNFTNPTGLKSSGIPCDSYPNAPANETCDIQFEVCVSDIGSK